MADQRTETPTPGGEEMTTVTARGTADPRPGQRESNRAGVDVGRAAGAQMTGQRQHDPIRTPAPDSSTPGPLTPAPGPTVAVRMNMSHETAGLLSELLPRCPDDVRARIHDQLWLLPILLERRRYVSIAERARFDARAERILAILDPEDPV